MARQNICRWYNESSGMKRACDRGLLDRKWIEQYCFHGGKECVRKQRFEQDGYVSPDYVLPDGTVDDTLKDIVEHRGGF